MEIEDATPEAVEAFIEGMYCGKMPDKQLLPGFVGLASKYMTQQLATAAMKVMIEEVDVSTVSDSVRTLRRFDEDDGAKKLWSELLKKLKADDAMLRKALEDLADGPCPKKRSRQCFEEPPGSS